MAHAHLPIAPKFWGEKLKIRKQTVSDALLTVVGTLRCHDGDDNENV